MNINLYPHNQTAYKAAVNMLKERKKAAIIHPTGTGKSFIGFKLCEDNPDKTICWLSPSRYIYQTQLENLSEISNGYNSYDKYGVKKGSFRKTSYGYNEYDKYGRKTGSFKKDSSGRVTEYDKYGRKH